jgi:hypothetical protein
LEAGTIPRKKHAKSLMKTQLRGAALVLAVLLVGLITAPTEAATIESMAVSVGRFNYARDNPETEIGMELRLSPRKWKLAPMMGLAGTDEGAVYVYGGLRRELSLDSHWRLTPSFAVSLYDEGDGHDLGGAIEFRSALEISYQTDRRIGVGLAIYHLSNGVLYEHNPGSNSVILMLSF